METYLVGGAVRDKLLGYPSSENDWVVVGAQPQELIDQGYAQVGKDFPVFLHPKTKEEYALARTERKTAPGYTGFEFYAAPDVTLEEDLARRDLSINAIAEDERGNLVDPFNGQKDIDHRILRHVSGAFTEDPVRILRVARFAARYHHLGFTVADETAELMKSMVDSGEADHLVAERCWKELSRALGERNPEVFIQVLRDCSALARIMPEVDALFGVPQRADYHPEIDTGIHTLMSLEQACRLSDSTTVRFATLVHDLGKALTPTAQLPSHKGHETAGIPAVKNLCNRLAVPNEFRELALIVCEYHLHCHRAQELKPSTMVKTLKKLDAFRRPERFAEFLLCCEADSKGRTGLEDRDYPSAQYFAGALKACQKVSVRDLINKGFEGQALGEELHKQQIHAVKVYKDAQQ